MMKIIKSLIRKLNPVKRNRKIRPHFLSGISAMLVSVLTVVSVFTMGNLDFGYKIECDGKPIGIISKRSVAMNIIDSARKELRTIPSAENAENIRVTLTVAKKENFTGNIELKDAVVACYDGKTACYGIFADGKRIAATATKAEATEALESYKKEFFADNNGTAYFSKKVEILPAREIKENISDKTILADIFKKKTVSRIVYSAEKDGTFADMSEQFGISEEKFKKLNPGKDPSKIRKGDSIICEKEALNLAVITASDVTSRESVSYETNKIEDNESFEGTTTVVKPGQSGEKEVKYRVVSENGVETSRKVLEENITKAPVAETVKIGTRPRTGTTGSFMTPYHGILTSRYGSYRSRGIPHTGIDLAGPEGSDILAADGGTVTHVGYRGSYGNLIVIKHDNGYETYYAHLSAFRVSNGQKVEKGQLIGLLGNTGNSTGPHLHFEVRQNGKNINPSQFITVE